MYKYVYEYSKYCFFTNIKVSKCCVQSKQHSLKKIHLIKMHSEINKHPATASCWYDKASNIRYVIPGAQQ